MQFTLTLYPYWSGSKVYKAMVDFQMNWDGWLESATLFPTTNDDCGLNFDELLGNGKGLGLDDDAGLSGLDWLDERVNFSILDETKSLLSQPDDAVLQMLDDAASFLMNIPDDNSSFLLPDTVKTEWNDQDLQNAIQPTTPVEIHVASSPIYEAVSEAGSPASNIVGDTDMNVNVCYDIDASTYCHNYCLSPISLPDNVPSPSQASSYCSSVTGADDMNLLSPGQGSIYCPSPTSMGELDAPSPNPSSTYCMSPASIDGALSPVQASTSQDMAVSVIILNNDDLNEAEEMVETIEDVAQSVKKRRYVRTTDKIPKIRVKNVFQPYSKSNRRQERKKVQNKEAAARYRIKKRAEEEVLAVEVKGLEEKQKALKSKHDDLAAEIKYLKSLMQEMFQKKGLL